MEVAVPPRADEPQAQDLLKTLFEKITRTLADTDAFTKADSPSFFIIYAHDNPSLGTANAGLVRELIDELKAIRLKILSDRSPTLRPWYTLEEDNAASNDAVHDILSNQFRILPNAGLSTETSVEKVILCYSDVLQEYHEVSYMKKYIQEIKDFYFRAQGESMQPKDLQDGILAIVKENHKKDGFHHVLTEMAFLDIRTTVVGNCLDIIPFMLNGGDIISLPYFRRGEPVYLKVEKSPAMIHSCQILHKTFFSLLRRIYDNQRECIDEFDNCYWKCAEGLLSKSKLPSWSEFERSVSLENIKSLERVMEHGKAGLRAIQRIEPRRSTQRAYIDTLAFKEMDYRMQEIREAYGDTTTWLTKHEDFIDWMKGRGILGVRGKPGSGKSTIMKTVFQLLDSSSTSDSTYIQLSFFYHRRGAAIQYSEIGMYRALLHQLLSQIPSAGVEFWQVVESRKKFQGIVGIDWEWRLEDLQQSFSAALLRASTSHRLRIFIDALDEAGTQHAKDIIVRLCEISRKLLKSGAHISICFSCRHFPNLPVKEDYRICVEEHNREDISTYLSSELEQRFVFRDAPEREKEVIDIVTYEIKEKAEGVFIWVALAVQLAANEWNHSSSLLKTQRILKKLPPELDETYRYILTQVVDLSKLSQTLQLMQWILLAEKPLSVRDLRFAIAAGDMSLIPGVDSCMDSKDFIESDESMKTLINSLTGGLAHVKVYSFRRFHDKDERTLTVQFIHQSVSDFLLQDEFKSLQQDVSNDGIAMSHDRITRSCVNYLKLELRRWGALSLRQIDEVPFATYAIRFWTMHANKAESSSILQVDLIEKLEWPACHGFKAWARIRAEQVKDLGFLESGSVRFVKNGSTLFHIASTSNLKSIVRELLQRDTCIEEADEEGNTAMHYASVEGHTLIVQMLVDGGAKISTRNHDGDSPLILAAEGGHIDTVKSLIHLGEDVNASMEGVRTPLHAAAQNGSIPLVRLLLGAGAKINAKGGPHGNALQAAASIGSKEVVQLLLDTGANVNAQGGYYGNALQAAASIGSKEVIQLLLDAGANVNAQGGQYGNALQAAAARTGSKEVVQLLLNAGADVNMQGGEYGNALQAAAAAWIGSKELVQLLLNTGANVNAQGGQYGTALQAASWRSSKEVVQLLLDAGANVNAQGGLYGNALQAALERLYIGLPSECPLIIQFLVEAGADVEELDEKHWEKIEGWANPSNAEGNGLVVRINKRLSGLLLNSRVQKRRKLRRSSRKAPKRRR